MIQGRLRVLPNELEIRLSGEVIVRDRRLFGLPGMKIRYWVLPDVQLRV